VLSDGILRALKDRAQWMPWLYERRDCTSSKIRINPRARLFTRERAILLCRGPRGGRQ